MNSVSIDERLHRLTLVLKHHNENIFVLNFEKCHLMVEHEVILGHLMSFKGIEVDKAKVNII